MPYHLKKLKNAYQKITLKVALAIQLRNNLFKQWQGYPYQEHLLHLKINRYQLALIALLSTTILRLNRLLVIILNEAGTCKLSPLRLRCENSSN